MSEDRQRQWVAGQLKDRSRDRHERMRRERAQSVQQTRNVADRCLTGTRIDREALQRMKEEDNDLAL